MVPTDPPRPLPPLNLVDADGNAHTLAEFSGRGVVLNLWATWCVPCVAEMPALNTLAGQVGPEIAVLALSSDRGGAPTVEAFYREHAITNLSVWLDLHGDALHALNARGIPTTLIIDKQGRERGRLEGAIDWARKDALDTVRRLAG
ncbi:MAG: TlpA family protein disulfide reductase [Acidisphaera sp.]|nr:TlpA family protein disulfide reductase [Acidisphaera sp.]